MRTLLFVIGVTLFAGAMIYLLAGLVALPAGLIIAAQVGIALLAILAILAKAGVF